MKEKEQPDRSHREKLAEENYLKGEIIWNHFTRRPLSVFVEEIKW